jgi:hypothetical protein
MDEFRQKIVPQFKNFDSNTVGISFGTFASLGSISIPLMSALFSLSVEKCGLGSAQSGLQS